ncbi:hypothetical protein SADUNF_Sadunf16G0009000 [Salix dunnii]|uniref:Uncharacterized protein n=1 Tax=Salix dunnii TaxID=1413687 RepID=A0A835J7A0_9ROSI|nr:hypothetical protein SADUNF_Sadunf16G0009000 [Salix dunnii]
MKIHLPSGSILPWALSLSQPWCLSALDMDIDLKELHGSLKQDSSDSTVGFDEQCLFRTTHMAYLRNGEEVCLKQARAIAEGGTGFGGGGILGGSKDLELFPVAAPLQFSASTGKGSKTLLLLVVIIGLMLTSAAAKGGGGSRGGRGAGTGGGSRANAPTAGKTSASTTWGPASTIWLLLSSFTFLML